MFIGLLAGEHRRRTRTLIRQAKLFEPFTRWLFRDAGIGPGQRVLDIGSGLGDVSMLVARLVGPTGVVVGVDNDAHIIAKAKTRAAEAGLQNVSFIESEVGRIAGSEPFDAIVGRLILEFLPDPSAVVSSLAGQLRPGGVLATQDGCWGPFLTLTAHLPLRSRCASLIHQAFQRSGANMDMELVLYRTFQLAGLPAPSMRIEIPVGTDPDFRALAPRSVLYSATADGTAPSCFIKTWVTSTLCGKGLRTRRTPRRLSARPSVWLEPGPLNRGRPRCEKLQLSWTPRLPATINSVTWMSSKSTTQLEQGFEGDMLTDGAALPQRRCRCPVIARD